MGVRDCGQRIRLPARVLIAVNQQRAYPFIKIMSAQHPKGQPVFHAHAVVEIELARLPQRPQSEFEAGRRTGPDRPGHLLRPIASGVQPCENFLDRGGGKSLVYFAAAGGKLRRLCYAPRASHAMTASAGSPAASRGATCAISAAGTKSVASPSDSMSAGPICAPVRRKTDAGLPRQTRQEIGSANIRIEPDAGFGHRETRVLGHDPVRTMHRKPGAPTHGDAVEQRDIGFRKCRTAAFRRYSVAKNASACAVSSRPN